MLLLFPWSPREIRSTVVDFSLYKVIAKVLSPHIHKVLHEIIHWSQDFS